jgi:transcription initiation factor IIE alpha subunit
MKKLIVLLIAISSAAITFAQEKAGKKDTTQHSAVYTCPMHPDVTSDKPGKCPKCGMDLNLSAKEQMKMQVTKAYCCSAHPDVTSDKPGKCPKCGKKLSLTAKEKMKMEVMKEYSCPMHPDVTSDKPGKCSKCGMALTEVKLTEKNK